MVKALQDEHELIFFDWNYNWPYLNKVDWVIHLGAISSTVETNVDKILEQNYDFSRWLLGECQRFGVNLQYASSASVYGRTTSFKETDPVNPINAYAWSKYLFERHVHNVRDSCKFLVQGFRYFNVYGPHEDNKGSQASVFHKWHHQAQTEGKIQVFEESKNYYRDFVPVETLINVHKTFLKVQESGVWNVGTGKARSFQEVAEEIAQKYNATIEYVPMPENLKSHYQEYTCADITKLSRHYP